MVLEDGFVSHWKMKIGREYALCRAWIGREAGMERSREGREQRRVKVMNEERKEGGRERRGENRRELTHTWMARLAIMAR